MSSSEAPRQGLNPTTSVLRRDSGEKTPRGRGRPCVKIEEDIRGMLSQGKEHLGPKRLEEARRDFSVETLREAGLLTLDLEFWPPEL